MEFPWLFVGPAGAGKTQAARQKLADSIGVSLADVYPKDIRPFKVADDYECRVYCSPYHFEIDVPDMSMQDKQILVEVLSMLFSAGDVFSGLKTNKRKLVILRRAHCLSLAAAIRLRWILETCVCPVGGTGMIWLCAREITGSLTVVEDIFVRSRVPCLTKQQWTASWSHNSKIADMYELLDARMDRAKALERWGATCLEKGELPRIATSCYDNLISEILRGCITAALKKIERPPLALATWIRERVYDLLGLCQTGTEFLDGYSAAIELAFQNSYCSFDMFRATIAVLASSEPNTSYRNPISLEKILLDITNALWVTAAQEPEAMLLKLESKLPIVEYGAILEPPEDGVVENTGASGKKAPAKKPSARGAGKPKKTGESDTSTPAKPRAKPRAKKAVATADLG
jgi:hypothetical protein